jgi:acyl-CoA thioesterase-1
VGVGARDGRGYVVRLADGLRRRQPVELVNLCVSGATSADVLARQIPRLRPGSADLLTVMIGVNDLWRMTAVPHYASAVERITESASQALASGGLAVLASLPQMEDAPAAAFVEKLGLRRSLIGSRVREMNHELARIAAKRGLLHVDLATESIAGRDDLFSADGFHPSASGYQRLAELLQASIEPALAKAGSARAS